MPKYGYVARTRLGAPEKGALEAPSPDDAIAVLQARDLIVISIQEEKARSAALGRKRKMHQKVGSADLIVFSRSLATMTEAGLPLLRAMEIVGDQTRSKRLSGSIAEMIRDIRGGLTFRDALAKNPDIFSNFWISLIETGEASGQLAKSLEQIANYLEKAGSIQRKVVSAMVYPVILLAVSVIAVLVFTLKIIPTFGEMFKNMNAELPALTQAVLTFSHLLRNYFLFLAAGLGTAWFLLIRYIHTSAGRWQFDKLKLQLPIFGPVFQGVAAEQFASNLSTLLKAGVPILHALEIVITTCGNRVVGSVLEHMRSGVQEGRPLAEPLSKSDVFPMMVSQMIAVGEQTGKLSSMLDEVAKYYEEQVSTAVERMASLLEPVMLIGMAVVIGILVVSMYLPIFQLSQTIRG